MKNEKIKKLERFVVDNVELEQLEKHLSKFNIFEAIGISKQELRHSDFLSFILDPARNHGLGDLVIKYIGKDIVSKYSGLPINAIEIDVLDLEGIEVRREWRNIDILLIDKNQKILIVIENKIDSEEGENQLKKYTDRINTAYPNYRKLKVFLTPAGTKPSENDWLPYSYKNIHDQLEKVISSKKSVLGDEILNLIIHYNEMLRRYIMPDTDIIELCKSIYNNHKEALDLIFENKPDFRLDRKEYLQEKIINDERLILDQCSKKYIRFALPKWDEYKSQKAGSGWTKSGRILLFEFKNKNLSLSLVLRIGPGPDKIRESLFKAAKENKLQITGNKLSPEFKQIHKINILSKKDLEALDQENNYDKIDMLFESRLQNELEKIEPIFANVFRSMDYA